MEILFSENSDALQWCLTNVVMTCQCCVHACGSDGTSEGLLPIAISGVKFLQSGLPVKTGCDKSQAADDEEQAQLS